MSCSNQYIAAAGLDVRSLENPKEPVDVVWEDAAEPGKPVRVTPKTAITLAAVWQAVNVLSGDVAQLPIKVYRRLDGETKEVDRGHPAWRLLHRRPSRRMNLFQFKQWMMYHVLLGGNAYARIRRSAGAVTELIPIEAWLVTPEELPGGDIVYRYHGPKGDSETFQSHEILHLRGPGGDVLSGQSVISIARESLSVGMNAQRYGERYFANDATPRLALEPGEHTDEKAARNMLSHWEKRHGGAHRSSRVGILDPGTKLHTLGMSNEDVQFLGTRQFSRSEVASWFNVPPHKVGDLERATFSNIEQQSIDYVVYSLMPWLVRWQHECNDKLFTQQEIDDDSHFCEFEVAALLRGDFKTRTEGYASAIMSGWMTRNEVRAKENMNPEEGLDRPLSPMNMTPARGRGIPSEDVRSESVQGLFTHFLEESVRRAWQRTLSHAAKAAKSPGDLQAWWAANADSERGHAEAAVGAVLSRAREAGLGCADEAEFGERFAKAVTRVLGEELDGPQEGLRTRLNQRAGRQELPAQDFMGDDQWRSDSPPAKAASGSRSEKTAARS